MIFAEAGDEDLLDSIVGGEPEALRELYKRHGRMVYSLALHVVWEPSLAEEVTQDAFMKVWEKSGTYVKEKAKPLTWLLRVTRNLAIDKLRQKKVGQGKAFALSEKGWENVESLGPGPEEAFAHSSRNEGVRRELQLLPEAHRQALSMAFYQGLTHREIAQRLSQPLGTVKSRIREALLKLRERIAK